MNKPLTTHIISGSLKGRVLQLPQAEAARPTRNRILQAAFNVLQGSPHFSGDFEGLRVLELCCGSGAWGLEALSRGAAHVTLVDTHPKTAQSNVQTLGVGAQVQVVQADAASFKPQQSFDVILADPPYAATELLDKILSNAKTLGAPQSLWLIETAATAQPNWPSGFTVLLTRVYGVSALHLARWEGA